jgi:putative ABC transport system permease protein
MSLPARFKALWRNLFRRRSRESELADEVLSYYDDLQDEYIRNGVSPAEASRRARLELGSTEQVKEQVRSARAGHFLDSLLSDTRYAIRFLGNNPGFAAAAVLTLALGIGANTAIFTVLNAVILRPLPYHDPSRLALIWTGSLQNPGARDPAAGPQLTFVLEHNRNFEDIGAIWASTAALTGLSEPEQLKAGNVTSNFFHVLGVTPQLGRDFASTDHGQGAPRVLILSNDLWRRRFAADPSIVGKPVRYQGRQFTVVGVLPRDFRLIFPTDSSVPADLQAFTPFPYDLHQLPRDLGFLRLVARLRPGVTVSQAQSELDELAGQLRAQYTEFATQATTMRLAPLHQDSTRDVRTMLFSLFGGVAMILLIACANVANLLLSRAAVRRKEITLRVALGAPRSRIIRQLLVESLLLSFTGALLGLSVAWAALQLFLMLRPASLLRLQSVQLDFTSFAFTFAAALLTGVLFGFAPVLASSRLNLVETLKQSSHALSSTRRLGQRALVVAEVALGFVLLIGATLMAQTFAKLINTSPGFSAGTALTFQIAPTGSQYKSDADVQNFFLHFRQRIAALPGVEAVGASSHLPFDDYPNWYEYYSKEGAPASEQTDFMADHRAILPGYFAALGAQFVAGRDFTATDNSSHPNVIVVDESLARRTWPSENPLGKKLRVSFIHSGSFDPTLAEVVGVVKHIRYQDPMREVRGQVYVPYAQSARENLGFVVRVSPNAGDDPAALIAPIRHELDQLDKDIPLAKIRPLSVYVAQSRAATRFAAVIAGSLAGLALLLAALGVYAVSSYAVSQRTTEMGIRTALGAGRRQLLVLVLLEEFAPVLFGVGIGTLLSLRLIPLLRSLLFGVSPFDPLTFLAIATFLVLVGLAACYLPARRASRSDPLIALRHE